jgi:hypothetical protein
MSVTWSADLGCRWLCDVRDIPVDMCELSQLQMLNLSYNWVLLENGCSKLAQAPLWKVLGRFNLAVARHACCIQVNNAVALCLTDFVRKPS